MKLIKNTFRLKTMVTIFLLLYSTKITAQKFLIDTADNRIAYFKTLISKKENTVRFIEYVLVKQGIPKALRNLAIIESGLINNSVSCAQAAGTWQFTPAAATGYGMEVSGKKDERFDLYKSTFAAAKYLRNLHLIFPDWKIVVAAYNCGSGNVYKAIKKAGSTNYDQFCYYLPGETREHVKKFMMACYASDETAFLNLPVVLPHSDLGVKNIKVSTLPEALTSTVITGSFLLPVIAKILNITLTRIQYLNPLFTDQYKKNEGITLVLPIDKMPDFLLLKNEILSASLN